jgi:two-component system chemotaxis sensor kinase CheA
MADRKPPKDPTTELVALGAILPLPEDADLEFVGKFITESRRYLREAGAAVEGFDDYTLDSGALEAIQRSFHTIKANAAALCLKWIERLAHDAEALLEHAHHGEISWQGPCAEAVFQTLYMMEHLLAEAESGLNGREMRRPDGYLELLQQLTLVSGGASEPAVSTPVPASADRPAAASGVSAALQQSHASLGEVARPPISVPAEKLDRLLEVIGEMVTKRSAILQHPFFRRPENADLGRQMNHISKLVQEAHQLTMSLRMVRLKRVFAQVARHVRDLSVRTGKPVTLDMVGEEIEIDRGLADSLGDPLMHLVRNAVDHGIEPPEERRRSGKPLTATISLTAALVDGTIRIELRDDGRGLDRTRILAKAAASGLVARNALLEDQEVLRLIFAPGFSTATKVTSLSGRGVGLDAVRRSVESMRGRITVTSLPGRGCTFQLLIPPSLAVIDGMLVRVGSERYIVPSASVLEVLRPRRSDVAQLGGKIEFVMVRNKALPLIPVSEAFGVLDAGDLFCGLWLVTGSGDEGCVLLVDELLDRNEFVVKPLGSSVGKIRGISGTTVLGDGTVCLILDIGETISLVHREREVRHA